MSASSFRFVDPRTGEPLKPLYVRPNGSVVWPVMGASPEDESSAGEDEGSEDEGSAEEGSGEGESGTDGEDEGSGGRTYTESEYQRLFARMQAADRAKSEIQTRLKALEDKDKTDLERAQGDLEELKKERDALSESMKVLRLERAFHGSDITWHDPEAALEMARSKYDLDSAIMEDGTVDAKVVKTALAKLAKEKAYLVKSDSEEGPPRSGGRVGSNRGDNGTDRDSIRKRFPALRR